MARRKEPAAPVPAPAPPPRLPAGKVKGIGPVGEARLTERDRHAAYYLIALATGPDAWDAAAAYAGFPSGLACRRRLQQPHMIRYRRKLKKAVLEDLSERNPKLLADIAATADNSAARVKAIQIMESMLADEHRSDTGHHAPGVTIVIEGSSPQPRGITVESRPQQMIGEDDD